MIHLERLSTIAGAANGELPIDDRSRDRSARARPDCPNSIAVPSHHIIEPQNSYDLNSEAMERQVSRSPLAHLYTPKTYVAHDVIDEVTKAALIGTGSGLFIAALKNALSRQNVGAWSVFTRGAPLIGLCGTPNSSTLYSMKLTRPPQPPPRARTSSSPGLR